MSSRSTQENKSFLHQMMPVDCLIFWIILSIAIPLTIVSISGFGVPIITWLETFMGSFDPEILETKIILPVIPLHVILFSTTGIVVSLLLFVIIQSKYISNWFKAADRRDFYKEININNSIKSLTGWIIYRFFFIAAPLVIMGVITLLMMIGSIQFFNVIAKMMGVNLELVMILSIFTALTTAFFWVCAVILSAWNLITSVYGSVISVIEPDVPNHLIKKRARRFAFLTSSSWGAYLVYLFMIGLYVLEFLYLLINPSFLSIQNIPLIALIQVVNITIFIALGRSITMSYYKSLLIQYAKISVKKTVSNTESANFSGINTDRFSTSTL